MPLLVLLNREREMSFLKEEKAFIGIGWASILMVLVMLITVLSGIGIGVAKHIKMKPMSPSLSYIIEDMNLHGLMVPPSTSSEEYQALMDVVEKVRGVGFPTQTQHRIVLFSAVNRMSTTGSQEVVWTLELSGSLSLDTSLPAPLSAPLAEGEVPLVGFIIEYDVDSVAVCPGNCVSTYNLGG